MNTYADPTVASAPAREKRLALWVMRGLAALATVVSGYLAVIALSGGDAVGCGGAMDCEEVLASPWSKWFGLPVSIPAFSMYATLLLVLLLAGPRAPENVRNVSWTLAASMVALAGAAAVWFVALQLFVVREFCTWCITVHVAGCGLLLLAVAAGRAGVKQWMTAAAAGSIGLALLVAGQLGGESEPRSGHVVSRIEADENTPALRLEIPEDSAVPPTEATALPAAEESAADSGSISWKDLELFQDPPDPSGAGAADGGAQAVDETGAALPPAPAAEATAAGTTAAEATGAGASESASGEGTRTPKRWLNVLDGRAELNAYQYPALGAYTAEHVILKLFDYTCPHCRKMHGQLEAAREVFQGRLAVLLIPVPLNADCNNYIVHTHQKHKTACRLAAFALAVWHADAEAFPAYHDWLMQGEHPPSVDDAEARAAQLIGREELTAHLTSARISERISVGTQLYQLADRGVIPKLLLPGEVVIAGRFATSDDLVETLKQNLEAPAADRSRSDGDVLP